ncbi:hypothetical protein [Variovorax boronicumulans]|nr:hypothetical protein [Variovorax boronicumulans]
MFSRTPKNDQLIDTSTGPRLSDMWNSKDTEIEWLRSKVLSLQLQLATRATNSKRTEWIGGVLGAIGAALLATDYHPGYGFAFFLASNAVWIRFAKRGRLFGMLAMQIVFTVTSLVGLWNWWIGRLVLSTEKGRVIFAVVVELLLPLLFAGGVIVLSSMLVRTAVAALARRAAKEPR